MHGRGDDALTLVGKSRVVHDVDIDSNTKKHSSMMIDDDDVSCCELGMGTSREQTMILKLSIGIKIESFLEVSNTRFCLE